MEDFLPVWQAIPALYPIADPTELSVLNQWYLERALVTTSPVYAGAIGRLQLRARRIVSFWADYDLLLTPTLALPPVPLGWDTEPDDPREQFDRAAAFTPFTAVFNVTGQPAVSLPLYWTDDGLPIGSSLWGRRSARRSCSGSRRSWRQRGHGAPDGLLTPDPREKDVRDGVTAPRTSLWGGDLQTRSCGCNLDAADVDPDRLPDARVQHLGRVAAADREGHVPVAVLVEHDVARPRVRERPRRDGVDPLAAEIELDLHPRQCPPR